MSACSLGSILLWFIVLFFILLLLLLFWFLNGMSFSFHNSPEKKLKNKYISGKISKREYKLLKNKLKSKKKKSKN